MDTEARSDGSEGLHPLAVTVGIVGLFVLILLVAVSSYQRERLQYMARRLLRKKRNSFSAVKNEDAVVAPGGLPQFVQSAAESGNVRVIKRWINSTNRDLNSRSNENLTALHYAARSGHNECVRSILAAGGDANVQDERHITPLHLAAVGGHALSVKLLLDHHADPYREDLDHQTALVLAEKSGNVGCARLLQRAMAKAALNEDSNGDSNLTLRAGTSRIENTV